MNNTPFTTLPQGYRGQPPERPLQQLGAYRVEGVLGQGAAAVVYRARRPDGSVVALKVLHREAGSNVRVREAFEREAKILLKLNHPAIVRALDAGQVDGYFFVALALVNGETVESLLTRQKKLGEAPAIDLCIQVANALDYLHRQHVVHRDVKPGNILLNERSRAILFDFGAAIDLGVERPIPGEVYGTPAFLSPEQARGDVTIDGRADIYSLGVTLYRMVAGRKPFYGSRSELLEAHLRTPPPRPSQFAYVSPALETVILTALAKNPDDRYQTGAAMATALEEARRSYEQTAPANQELPQRLLHWLRSAITPSE
ncbi:MAG: serine/threonine-protein kinase [Caldilinea sp.]